MGTLQFVKQSPVRHIDPTKVYIRQQAPANGDTVGALAQKYGTTVSAPLPERFGVPVANELSQPFANFIPQGPIQTFVAIKNLSLSSGFAIKKFFTGTAQPDITFDMNFVAKDDALNEVIAPVLVLYSMAAARKASLPDEALQIVSSVLTVGQDVAATGVNVATGAITGGSGTNLSPSAITPADVKQFLFWLHGPPQVIVQFGNLYSLNSCIISSMEPQFSDVLDYNGLPMQCNVSLTITMQNPYLLEDVASGVAQGYQR